MKRLFSALPASVAFAAALLLSPGSGPPATDPRPARSGAMEALEFWSGARAYPSADLPPDRHVRAFDWMRKATAKRRPIPSAGSGWRYIGPSNLSGRMLSVALNPLNPSTIYAGSASGGLWRSHTGGVAGDWERVATGHPVLGVAAIAIAPGDSNVVYIGTGEVYRYAGTAGGLAVRTTRGSYGMGLLKTTDGGATWSKSLDWSYNQERGVQAIRINPLNPSTVWAATTEGIYRSTDAGASWENLLPVQMGQDIVIHPLDTGKVLVTTGNLGLSNAFYRTTDAGATWLPVTPIDFSGKALLGQYASNPDVVYASVADSTTGVGSLWRTDDFGDGWTELSNSSTNALFGVQGWYSHFVAVHPGDSTIVVHAGVPARRSTDGGVTFAGSAGSYSDHHAYAVDPVNPDILYVANDDGIYRSTNFGLSFTQVSDNLATGQFYNGFSNSASDSLIALGQVQDHIPGYLYTGSDAWPLSAVDEVGWTGIDQSNDSIMYAGTRDGGAIRKSTNRGASFAPAGGGFSGISCWNAPFVVSPSNPNILYFGRSRIFRSTTSAATWSATNGGLVLDGNPALSMAVAASDPDVVYVGTAPRVDRTHVFATTNGGTSWTDVTGPLPDRYPLDIAVDPANPSVAYVGFGGYGTGHVFKTTDGGASWTDVTGDLPDIPVTALLVDPANSSVVYLGSDVGVCISTNGGGTWEPFGDGLPEAVLVSDLTMTASNRTLRASTHGNSVFERKMPSSLPSLSSVVPSGGEVFQAGSVQAITWNQALVPSVKVEFSPDDGSTWTTVAASVPAWPDSFAWTVPLTLTAQARVRVSSTADTLLGAQSAATFTIAYDGVILELAEEWNLVSLPLAVSDPSTGALFPAATGRAYRYDGGYAVAETLSAGSGYWIRSAGAGPVPIPGDSIAAETVAVAKGWNLVGSVTAPLDAGLLSTDPPGIVVTPFYAYDGAYTAEDTIRPGRGYWVKASGAGSLILAPPPPAAATGRSRQLPVQRAPVGSLTFTDARGRTARLALATELPADGDSYELPPLPPVGGFDVRFEGGSRLGIVGEAALTLRARGVEWPAVVAWSVPDGETYLLNAGPSGAIDVRGSGSVAIESAGLVSIRRASSGAVHLPAAFSLSQNYPNPFNPSTRIGFVVPAGGPSDAPVDVSLRVYDVAGRLTATLLSGGLPPGAHAIDWDASDLPGGVYFCVLRSGNESRAIKMLLLK